tara:strand:+ start:833 stop:1393 length:561 start_codon:yes stop_codon:yes gene_type:complete
MRIISGTFRGKKILEPIDIKTRPLKDLTKESIFNIIIHSNKFEINLKKANILDLFSGVGSFGLECLSRGVKRVTFVENYKKVLPILKKNLENLRITDNYKILEKDIYKENIFINFKNKLDIIFMDPPYKDKNLNKIFENIKNSKILKDNGFIILHRHKNEKDIFFENFQVIEEKKYGISKIIFIIN